MMNVGVRVHDSAIHVRSNGDGNCPARGCPLAVSVHDALRISHEFLKVKDEARDMLSAGAVGRPKTDKADAANRPSYVVGAIDQSINVHKGASDHLSP